MANLIARRRGNCPTKSSNLSDCVPFAAASWATLRSRWRNCLASPGRPSRGGGPPTLIMACKLCPGDRTGRPVGSGRTLNDGQAARLRTILNRKKPRGGGDRLPVVDPQGRRRVDPQGVRDRHAGADRRRVPRAVGLHCQGAAPSCQGSGPRGGPPYGWRSPIRRSRQRAAREDAENPLVRRDRRGGRPVTATGLRPRGAAGEDRGARSPHPQ